MDEYKNVNVYSAKFKRLFFWHSISEIVEDSYAPGGQRVLVLRTGERIELPAHSEIRFSPERQRLVIEALKQGANKPQGGM